MEERERKSGRKGGSQREEMTRKVKLETELLIHLFFVSLSTKGYAMEIM